MYLQLRPEQRLRQIFRAAHHAFVVGQTDVAFDHQRPGVFIQLAGIVQQAVAHLAEPAGAMRYSRKERHEGRFKRVGQHISAIVATFAQAVPKLTPFPDFQRAVAERHRDCFVDFRHAR